MNRPLPANDIQFVVETVGQLWEQLGHANIFVTGGSGFFGRWLLESLLHANQQLQLAVTVTALTRNVQSVAERSPRIAASPNIKWLQGDVLKFNAPSERFTHCIHLGGPNLGLGFEVDPAAQTEVIVEGTKNVVGFARSAGVDRLLLISSGAAYGQASNTTNISEDTHPQLDPSPARQRYGEAKREAERLAIDSMVPMVIARPFTLVGPGLPLNGPFAVGNFLRDALERKAIQIRGNGAAVRSYLYGADLAIWLWTLLITGKPGRAYNVGSDQPVSILELARMISQLANPPAPLSIANECSTTDANRYVPSIDRCRNELGLKVRIDLPTALSRTWRWLTDCGNN